MDDDAPTRSTDAEADGWHYERGPARVGPIVEGIESGVQWPGSIEAALEKVVATGLKPGIDVCFVERLKNGQVTYYAEMKSIEDSPGIGGDDTWTILPGKPLRDKFHSGPNHRDRAMTPLDA